MPLPVMPGITRVTFNLTDGAGHEAHNILHFVNISESEPTLQGIINGNLATLASPSHLFWPLPGTWSCTSADFLVLDGSATSQTLTITPTQTGGSSGSPVYQASGVVTLRTAQRGPRGRGRVYLGPAAEDAQASGVLTPSGKAVCQTAWTKFVTDMAADDAPLVVASYVHSDTHNVTSAVVRDYIGTQRRRARWLQG